MAPSSTRRMSWRVVAPVVAIAAFGLTACSNSEEPSSVPGTTPPVWTGAADPSAHESAGGHGSETAHAGASAETVTATLNGTDGAKVTLQCGGVARVRPDGTELELFATGKFKATGMPGKAWTEEERQQLKAEFDTRLKLYQQESPYNEPEPKIENEAAPLPQDTILQDEGIPGEGTKPKKRTDKPSNAIASWKDLWKPELKGRLALPNITTTQVYTKLDFQHLAKAYDAAHPRARRK